MCFLTNTKKTLVNQIKKTQKDTKKVLNLCIALFLLRTLLTDRPVILNDFG